MCICVPHSHTHTHTHTLAGLRNLEQLEYLDVSSNQLSRLRADLKDLTTLQTFIVSDNPLESPPMQVSIACGKGSSRHLRVYMRTSNICACGSLSVNTMTDAENTSHSRLGACDCE